MFSPTKIDDVRMFQKLREPLPEKMSFFSSSYFYDFVVYLPAVFLLCAGGGVLLLTTTRDIESTKHSVQSTQYNNDGISVTQQEKSSLQTKNTEALLYKARILAEKGDYTKSFIVQLDAVENYIKQKNYHQALSKIMMAETIMQSHIFAPYSNDMKYALIRTQDLRSEIYFYTKDIEGAAYSASKSLELALEYYGENHLETAKRYELVAYFYNKQGYPEKAVLCLHNAILTFEKNPETDEGELLIKLNNLGETYRRLQNYKTATEVISKAILRIEKKYGTDAPELAIPLNNLGLVAFSSGEMTKAEAYITKAYHISKKYQGDSHDVTGYIASNLQHLQNFKK